MSDAYSANTVLLLHMNGSNDSTTFTDSSNIPKPVTAYGNAQISTAQSKFGGSSGYFDGNGDMLSINHSPSFTFLNQNFTLELWLRASAVGQSNHSLVLAQLSNASQYAPWSLAISPGTANLAFYSSSSSGWNVANSALIGNLTLDVWHHAAVARQGASIYLFLDGVLNTTVNVGTVSLLNNSSTVLIGSGNYSATHFQGYLQDVRITNGIARYTANFTPPTAAFDDPDPVTGLILPASLRRDVQDGGLYRIAGTVDELGVPGPYRVRLFDRYSGRLVRETWSGADGSYAFDYLAYRANGYFAVAYDHGSNPLNAAIADLITPELMP